MMKILMVIPAVGAIYGGPSKIVLELAQGIGNLGIGVDIVTTNANGSTKLDVPLDRWISEEYYRIKYFPYWSEYKFSWILSKWLFNHVTDYDLIHTNGIFSYPILAAHWACKFHQIPYIATPHGMLEPWAMSYKAWKKRPYYSIFEKPALQQAQAIQITGSPEANSVKALDIQTPLIFVPNGIHRHEVEKIVSPEIFYQQFPDTRNKTLILFLGRIDPKKGLDLLSVAFAKVHTEFPHTQVIIAGPDNIGFLPAVRKLFAEQGCLDAVTFTGMLTGSVKYSALAAASIYVSPSYSEGLSMSVLEGMASGLPCVITTGCNFPEAAESQAAYVVNIDSQAIADALMECLRNPQPAKEMGARARRLILEKYTWEQSATKIVRAYEAIVKQQPMPALD